MLTLRPFSSSIQLPIEPAYFSNVLKKLYLVKEKTDTIEKE